MSKRGGVRAKRKKKFLENTSHIFAAGQTTRRLSVDMIIRELKAKKVTVKKNSDRKAVGGPAEASFTIIDGEEIMENVPEAELRGFAMNRGIV